MINQDSIVSFINKEEEYSFQIGWLRAVRYMQFLMEEEFGEFVKPGISSEEAYKMWKEEVERDGVQHQRSIRERVRA